MMSTRFKQRIDSAVAPSGGGEGQRTVTLESSLYADLAAWLVDDDARRRYKRWEVAEQATLTIEQARQSCVIQNISPDGACVVFEKASELPELHRVVLELEGFGQIPSEVRYVMDDKVGLMFLHDMAAQRAMAHWLLILQSERE